MTPNELATLARRYYETYLPSRVAAMSDPEMFFREFGTGTAKQIRSLEATMVGPDSLDEDYLAKLGRLGTARQQATEKILGETLYSLTPEPGTEEKELPMGPVPGVARVE